MSLRRLAFTTPMALAAAVGLWVATATVCAATNEPVPHAPQTSTTATARISNWGGKLKDAGTVGIVQFGLSAFGAIFIFERLFGLRRRHVVPEGLSARARKRLRDKAKNWLPPPEAHDGRALGGAGAGSEVRSWLRTIATLLGP